MEELLKRFDTAMYEAKAAGHNTLRFDPAMQAGLERLVDFVDEVRKILQSTGGDPRLFKLELTESMLLDSGCVYEDERLAGARGEILHG